MSRTEPIQDQLNPSDKFHEVYITSAQVSEYVGVSRVAVFQARKAGKLPGAIEAGGSFYWERTQIRPYIDAWRERVELRTGTGAAQ